MKLSLKGKITSIAIIFALLPVIVIAVLIVFQEKIMLVEAEHEIDNLAKANISQISKDVYNLCLSSDELLHERLSRAIHFAETTIKQKGGLSFIGKMQKWEAVNQFNGETRTVELPSILLGGRQITVSTNLEQYIPVVDDVGESYGLTCTIFQRMNSEGDMLRVATNVQTAGKERAISTFIPHINPDGSDNPVLQSILDHKTYHGRAYVVNEWCLTVYEPILDSRGEVIGMIYTGEKIAAAKSLRNAILRIKPGKTGYVYVLGGKSNKGHYIISKNGERDGENILESTDSEGKFFIKEIVEKALTLKEGENYFKEYKWKNIGEATAREKVVAITYFEPWDWVIGTGVYKDEYYDTISNLERKFISLRENLIIYGVSILVLAILLAIFLSNTISKPIGFISNLAKKIAEGKLREAKNDIDSQIKAIQSKNYKDEISELLRSFAKMTSNLFSLIGQVQQSGIQVTTSATEITASSRQLEATVAEQAASTRQVSVSSKEISDRAEELLTTVRRSGETVDATVDEAEAGSKMLIELENTMKSLTTATNSISTKLSIISDKADKINGIITAINKISEQTKLLSLNAAIEAEKAGDFGKGFSVVAREISRLAVQTATATKDIEFMVKEMQGSVSSGVMEMDKFGIEVKSGANKVSVITHNIELIIEHILRLTPEFEAIDTSISAQSEGAFEINEAMNQLKIAAEQTKESLGEFHNVTLQLNEAVKGLQREVSQFKISK